MSADPSVPHSYEDEDEFSDEHDLDQTPEHPDRDDAQVTIGTNRLGTETAYHAFHGRDRIGSFPDEARARAALWDHENSGGSKGYFPNHWVDGHLDTSNDRAEYEKDPHAWLSKNSESYAKETENDAGDMVDDAMADSEHLKGLLTDNKIGPTKYSSLTGQQTCVHCQKPIEEGMGGAWVDENRSTGDYRTNHLHEPMKGFLDAADNIEHVFKNTSPEVYDELAENPIGPTKWSKKTAGQFDGGDCDCAGAKKIEPHRSGDHAEWAGRMEAAGKTDGWGIPIMQPFDGHGAWDCNNYGCTEHPQSMYDHKPGQAPGWLLHDTVSPAERDVRKQVNDATSGSEWLLDQQHTGPSKYSSRLPVRTAAVPNTERDKGDMSGHCADGNHDECEDYSDTNCLCECHDHHGVPAKYKTGWEDDQYYPRPFKGSKTAANDAEMSQYSNEVANGRGAEEKIWPDHECDFCGMQSNAHGANGEVVTRTHRGDAMHPSCAEEWEHGVGVDYGHDIEEFKADREDARQADRDDDYYHQGDGAHESDPYDRHADAMDRHRTYLLRQIEAGLSPLDPAFGKTAGFDVEIPGSTQPMPSPDQVTTKPRQMPSDSSIPFSDNDPNNAESLPSQGGAEEGGDGVDSKGVGEDQEGKFASMVGYVMGSNPGISIDEARRLAATALRVETTRKQA